MRCVWYGEGKVHGINPEEYLKDVPGRLPHIKAAYNPLVVLLVFCHQISGCSPCFIETHGAGH